MAREKNKIDKTRIFVAQSYNEMPAITSEGMAEASLKNYTVLFKNLGLDSDTLMKRFTPYELNNMLGELPQIFRDEHIQKIVTRLEKNKGTPDVSCTSDIDEQIKGIAAYLKERENTLHELPALPREALEQLVAIKKPASMEEIIEIQERILHNLRHRHGNFDEGNLVLFLVKYLL